MSTSSPSGVFMSLVDSGLPVSQGQYLQIWLTAMQAQYPGYTPSLANPEYVQAYIFSAWAAANAQLCSAGATELFRQFGTQLLALPYEQGTPAQAIVTVTAIDTLGHTLPAGTQFTLTLSGSQVGFQTVAPLTIAPSSNSGQV